MPSIPPLLAKKIAEKRLVPFVGAGVSRSVLKKNGENAFPTWPELLLQGALALRVQKPEVAKAVEANIELLKIPQVAAMSPVQIADLIYQNLSPRSWTDFLKQQLDPSFDDIDETSLELSRTIWDLADNFVITTNFDKVLQWGSKRPLDAQCLQLDDYSGLSQALNDGFNRPTVWHLHGCIENPTKLILTSDMYNRLYSGTTNPNDTYAAALITLKAFFTGRTMLFIGFSFADEYVRFQLQALARIFSGFGGEHFALVRQSEFKEVTPLLDPLEVTAVPFADYGQPLIDTLEQISSAARGISPTKRPDLKEQVTQGRPPTSTEDRWRVTSSLRFMDQLGPTYILDREFYFMDWNAAFDRIFAKPLSLYRGQHALEFISRFANRDAVEERARKVFQPDNPPPVDMEQIFFKSDEFGVMELWKIAAAIYDEEGNLVAWSVGLNVIRAEKQGELWDAIKEVIDRRLNWARYAGGYDDLLLDYDPYRKLVSTVCSKIQGAVTCADIGAGTGNGALELLKQDPDRTIYAIEPNEDMLMHLQHKLDSDQCSNFRGRIQIMKQDAAVLRYFDDGFFDGAIMINALYAIDDPKVALKEAARVLQPNGVLALSTPHSGTDVGRLFKDIVTYYAAKGKLQEKKEIIDHARKRHENMMKNIHRDTEDQIRHYIEDAGFRIVEWTPGQYSGAVVVIKALKKP
jgi:ubiquinone/menaquinone biosynthesis C-methylase UbiE